MSERASTVPTVDARQERGVEEEVARGYDGDVVQGRVDVLEERHRAPAAAEDHQPLPFDERARSISRSARGNGAETKG